MIPCGKIVYFTFKNRFKNASNRELCNTGSFANIPQELHRESSSHLEGYCEPMSKWKLVNFSMVGKPLLGETNFPFDINGSKRDF